MTKEEKINARAQEIYQLLHDVYRAIVLRTPSYEVYDLLVRIQNLVEEIENEP